MVEESKFKVGDLWKTRNGLKAEILKWGDDYCIAFIHDTLDCRFFSKTGRLAPAFGDRESLYDLVEPWVDTKKERGYDNR